MLQKLGNLFKSPEQWKREQRLAAARAERELNVAINKINSSASALESKRDKFWDEAKAAMVSGRTQARNRALMNFKRYDGLAQQQMDLITYLEGKQLKVTTAATAGAAIAALAALASKMNVNADTIAADIDDTMVASSEIDAAMGVIEGEIKNDQTQQQTTTIENVMVDPELLKSLEMEVLGAPAANEGKSVTGSTANLSGEINAGLNKVNELLKNSKS